MALRRHGYPGPEEMTPGQVIFARRVTDGEDARDMDRAVVAGSVAQADKKDRKDYWDRRKDG